MKRLWALLCAVALAAMLAVPALAAGSAELVRAFVYGGTLYTYVDISDCDGPITKADARIGEQTFPAAQKLETVRQAGSPVTYLLLVDNSTSMPDFAADVRAFAEGLAQGSGENARFTLATFGRDFTVVAEDLAAGELSEELDALSYEENITRLHSGIAGALDWFEAVPRAGNELRTMVVLTDAVQYDPRGGVPYEELLERVGQSDVMLHAVGFGDDAEALASMENLILASGGFQWVVGPEMAGGDAAAELTGYTDRLFVTGFDLEGLAVEGTRRVSVTFGSGAELICRAETEVDLPAVEAGPKPDGPKTPLPPPEEGGEVPADPPAREEPPEDGPNLLVTGVAGAAVLAVAAVAVLLLRKRKKAAPTAAAAAPAAPGGVYMRLEVLRGELLSGRTEFELAGELPVGGDPACAVAFRDLAPRSCRIFLAEGAVWAEGLCAGVRVNGEEVPAPRRLRSGDEIDLGGAAFRLKF